MHDISIFLSYAFTPKSRAYSKAEIESVIEESCNTAQTGLVAKGYPVNIHFDPYLDSYGADLNEQLRLKMAQADIAIIEISEANLNVFYELGLSHGYNKHSILIQKQDSPTKVPSDLKGFLVMKYEKISDIRGRLAYNIERYLEEVLENRSREHASRAIRQLWNFGEKSPTVINVIGPDTRRLADLPNENFPDYSFMEFLGDKDAVVEVSIQLARHYPFAVIARYASSKVLKEPLHSPSVVIGGPISEDGVGGNPLNKELTDHFRLPVAYSEDCETLIVNRQKYRTEYDDMGALKVDYGVLARLPNPWDHDKRILIIHGAHTYGVLGATLSITDSNVGRENSGLILDVCGEDPLFYAWCRVPVITGIGLASKIERDNIKPLRFKLMDVAKGPRRKRLPKK